MKLKIARSENIDKKKVSKLKGFTISSLIGIPSSIVIHELGHIATIKSLGKSLKFHIDSELSLSSLINISYDIENVSSLMKNVVNSSGVGANYLTAFASLYLSNKTNNPVNKASLRYFSAINAILPSIYSFGNYLGISGGDFTNLTANGIGYEYTLPITSILSIGILYGIYKQNKKENNFKEEKFSKDLESQLNMNIN